jgi:hypothetical protein
MPVDLLSNPSAATHAADADGQRIGEALFEGAAERLRHLPPERFETLEELRATAQAIADEAKSHGLTAIDHLIGNDDLSAFHAVQGAMDDPAALRAYVGRAQFLSHAARAKSLELVNDRVRETRDNVVGGLGGLWGGIVRGLDQNGDGKLGLDDVGAFFTRTLDQNGDGKLNLADVGALFDQTGDGKFGLDDAAVLIGGLFGGRRR